MDRLSGFVVPGLLIGLVAVGAGCGSSTGDGASADDGPTAAVPLAATDLEGYWRCSRDGSVTHITNVDLPGGGSGSYTPPGGTMIPEGLFRSIRFLGSNRWEAMERERSFGGVSDQPEDPFAWHRVVIEMLDRNTFRIGKTVYRRV